MYLPKKRNRPKVFTSGLIAYLFKLLTYADPFAPSTLATIAPISAGDSAT